MLKSTEFVKDLNVGLEFERPVAEYLKLWLLKNYVDILVVVDSGISVDPANDFGIASVIELIRNAKVGCMRFRVDLALRNGEVPAVVANPTAHQHKYRGFRFDMMNGANAVIDKYEQIWCFGFSPGNSGNVSDAPITQPGSFPASDAELAKLSTWMKDKRGGVFGTGDHHFLGASTCKRIPRLGTMRRWTNADGVPTQFGMTRIDTLRPPSAAYEPGAPGGALAMANTPHQGDLTVQPIQWTAWRRTFWPFRWKKRPHPVLCHPTLGPINVMPDHAHEGWCVEAADVDLNATYNFGTGDEPEYPDATDGGDKPQPFMIARGSNLGQPPYNFEKNAQEARTGNPMISVYDGHPAGVGRVASDSTWHHWMDVNIDNMRAADNNDWKKISRYFINLAVWLSPPGFSTHCFYVSVVASHFQTPGFQEYMPKATVLELGRSLRAHLTFYYGPCWVTDRIWEIIWFKKLLPFELLRDPRRPKLEIDGIDPDLIEDLLLGHMVKATMDSANAVKAAVAEGKGRVETRLDPPDKAFDRPLQAAITELGEGLREHFELGAKLAAALR